MRKAYSKVLAKFQPKTRLREVARSTTGKTLAEHGLKIIFEGSAPSIEYAAYQNFS